MPIPVTGLVAVMIRLPLPCPWESLERFRPCPTPLILHVLLVEEPCEGSGESADLISAFNGLPLWGVVSWMREHDVFV